MLGVFVPKIIKIAELHQVTIENVGDVFFGYSVD